MRAARSGSASAPTTRVTSSPPADSSREEHLAGRVGDVGVEEGDVTVDDAEDVARAADPCRRERLLRGHRDGSVPRRDGGPGHGDDVRVHRASRVEHRQRGEGLHRRARRHDVGVDALARRRLGRDLGRHEGVAVAGDEHHGGRPGRAHGLEELAGRGPPRRPGPHDDAPAASSRTATPGPDAQHATTDSGTGCSRADTWLAKCVMRMRSGRPATTPASTAAPGSSTWTWTFQRSGPPTTSSESPRPSSVRVSVRDGLRGRLGEEEHHLVCRAVTDRLPGPVERVVTRRRTGGPGIRPGCRLRLVPLRAPGERRTRRQEALVGGAPAPRDDPVEGLEHEDAAGAPGVDHARPGEGLELVGGAGEGLLRGVDGGLADVGEGATGVGGLDRGGRTRVGDGEDRALLRVGHAGPCGSGPAGEGGGEEEGVDGIRVTVGHRVAQSPDELAHDDAGVAPGREEDGPLEGAALLHERGLPADAGEVVGRDDLVDGRVEREVEVGAGVTVGHGEDVEGVDLGAPGREGRTRQQRPVSGVGGSEDLGHAPQGNGRPPRSPGGVLVRRARLGYSCPVARALLRRRGPPSPHP